MPLVLVGVLTIVFFLMRLTGDPALLFLPAQATPQDVAIYKAAHGLDRPLPVQYGYFLADAARGDFGRSLRFGEPALGLVLSRLPASLLLAGCAAVVGLALAAPLGIVAALRRGRAADSVAMLGALLGQSFPQFWLGLMLILLLAVRVRAFPPSGAGGIQFLVLPSLTLGLAMAALLARLLRANLIDVLGQDYIRTGRAKGLARSRVVARHALKNATLPSLTVFGLQLGLLISNAVVVEFVFGYPGMGRLALTAINQRDYPVVLAFIFVVGLVYAGLNLVVDVLYTWLDPRIRLAV
ncbi:MAG TPA: ABC transporter permease [Chloroflexota bacterium]